MKLLVIGGTGFIGPHVVRQLAEGGHQVAVFHRGKAEVSLPGNVETIFGDRNQLSDHAAALRGFKPEVVIDVILSSGAQARQLMDTFRGVARRVVVLSSMDVYRACGVLHGSEPGPLEPLPLTEESRLREKKQTYPPAVLKALQGVFGWVDDQYDKIPVERRVLSDADLPATVLRLPMVYGPGDPLRRFYPVVKRIEDGRRKILFAEEMAAWRSPRGYVENVAAAITLAACSERAAGEIYNVAEESAYSELEWAQKIAVAMNWKGEFVALPLEKTPAHLRPPGNAAQHWVASSNKIREQLGYRELVPIEEAIRRTNAWERTTPPPGASFHQFDYGAEDEAA
jgi:nucleoside-diphosphate-sugar epimerase